MTDQNETRRNQGTPADEHQDDATNEGASSTAPAEGADDAPDRDAGSPAGDAEARSK